MIDVLGVRGALPPHRHPQAEITDVFADVIARGSGLDQRVLRRFHANAGVEYRHLVMPIERYGELEDFDAGQRPLPRARRRRSAPAPSSDALKAADLTPQRAST